MQIDHYEYPVITTTNNPKATTEEDRLVYPQSNPRIKYLRRLYFLISVQQLIVTAMAFAAYFSESFKNMLNNTLWLLILSASVVGLIMIATIFFWRTVAKFPISLLLFSIFTVFLAFLCAYPVAYFNSLIPCNVYLSFLAISVGLFIYTLFNKVDITYMGTTVYILGAVILVFEGFAMFSRISFLGIVFVAAASIIWGLFLMLATQTLFTGAKYNWSTNEWIMGAVSVYADVVRLFFNCCELLRNLLMRNAYK